MERQHVKDDITTTLFIIFSNFSVVLLIAPILHKLLPHQWIALMETKAAGDFLRELEEKELGNQSKDIELATKSSTSLSKNRHKEHGSDGD